MDRPKTSLITKLYYFSVYGQPGSMSFRSLNNRTVKIPKVVGGLLCSGIHAIDVIN
jgi:hypothetical protein